MANNDFLKFCGPLEALADHDPAFLRNIARNLSSRVRKLAVQMFMEPGMESDEAIYAFFSEAFGASGDSSAKLETPEQFDNLLKNWAKTNTKAGSAQHVLSVLYYLYTIPAGKNIISSLEQSIFRKTYEDISGYPFPVPSSEKEKFIRLDQEQNFVFLLSRTTLSYGPLKHSKSLFDNILGRADEKASLREFAHPGPGFRWLQIAGEGGQGKSSLAHDLANELGDAWEAGILAKRDLEAFLLHGRAWQPTKPHLIIIDQITGFEQQTGEVLGVLASRQSDGVFKHPVCVLLLERQRWDRGGLLIGEAMVASDVRLPSFSSRTANWFEKVNFAARERVSDLSKSRYGTGILELTALTVPHLIAIARQSAKDDIGHDLFQSDWEITRHLERIDISGRPLYAILLGRAMAAGGFRDDWERSELLRSILDNEYLDRWKAAFDADPPSLIDDHPAVRLALLATLAGVVEISDVEEKLGWTVDSQTILQALTLTGGHIDHGVMGPGQRVSALAPRLLGEWFVLSALTRKRHFAILVSAAWEIAPKAMAAFLLNVVQDFPEHTTTVKLLDEMPPAKRQNFYRTVAPEIVTRLAQTIRTYPETLMRILQEAADRGEPEAKNVLGWCLMHGQGVIRDRGAAHNLYISDAQNGNYDAMNNLAIFFYTNKKFDPSGEIAADWWIRAASDDHLPSMCNLAIYYAELGDHDISLNLIATCVEREFAPAMYALGVASRKGAGIPVDPVKSFFWTALSAERGFPPGMYSVGFCLFHADESDRDEQKALYWWKKGSSLNDVNCMHALGNYYFHFGVGGIPDHKLGISWYQSAEAAGSVDAHTALREIAGLGLL